MGFGGNRKIRHCTTGVSAGCPPLDCLPGTVLHSYLVAGDVTFRGSDYPVRLTTDILNAPIFLFAGAKLLNLHPGNLATRVLRKIGDKSMLMWFFHCLFFNCMESYTQWLLYLPRNPILVLVWGLAMCWLLAYAVEPVRKFLIDLKHRLFCKLSDFRKS